MISLIATFFGSVLVRAETIFVPAEGKIEAFNKEYLLIEIARNFPVSFAQNRFEPGEPHPVIGYRHRFEQDWLMGIGGQFKIFQRRDTPKNESNTGAMALWTLYHETNYVLRLDHPNYLLIGPRITYFLPCEAAVIPLVRDPNLQSEIGAGISVSFLRMISDNYAFTARAERWRGTRTMILHGLEVSFGLNYSL